VTLKLVTRYSRPQLQLIILIKKLFFISCIAIEGFQTSSQTAYAGVLVFSRSYLGDKGIMRTNEISKDGSCTAVEKDPLHLLLEIERRFREEERKNLHSERGRSHQNLLKIIKKQSG
jgi:hypothetical protein